MTSRYSHRGAAVGPTLTGLSLAAAIAREAVDAVPVVKQALGVVVRILALAEGIDKDRDARHALVDTSVLLARRVRDVLGDEEPDPKILPSLERMYKAFRDVESFMAKHVARNRLSRLLGYAFTINHRVDRLSRNMEDALQEVLAVTLLAIQQDAHYDGEFRLIRHCQVDKLELIREDKYKEDGGNLVVRYHRARVDGQLLVVRCCEGSRPQDTHDIQTAEETLYKRMASCDLILKETSTVQRAHPNVARIYGWSKGPIHNRFTVFKSGFRDMDSVLHESPNPITTLVHWTFKLLDAVHHLKLMAVFWDPCGPAVTLDDHLEPTIGLQNDLRRVDPGTEHPNNLELQIYWILDPARLGIQWKDMASADVQAAVSGFHNERLNDLLGRFERVDGHRHVIAKAEFSHGQILNEDIAEGLLQLLGEEPADTHWQIDSWMWANILLALDESHDHQLKRGLKVFSTGGKDESDSFEAFAVDEDSASIVYERYRLTIGEAGSDEVKEILGIVTPAEDKGHKPYLIATGGPDTSHTPE